MTGRKLQIHLKEAVEDSAREAVEEGYEAFIDIFKGSHRGQCF